MDALETVPEEIFVKRENAIEIFDPYVQLNENNEFELNIPSSVSLKAVIDDATGVLEFDAELNENRKSELNDSLKPPKKMDRELKIDREVYDDILQCIEITNQKLRDGEFAVKENGTLYRTDDNLLYIQANYNVDATTTNWWGFKMWMCRYHAGEWNHLIDQVITGAGSAALLGTAVNLVAPGVGVGITIGAGIQTITLKLIYNDAVYKLDQANPDSILYNWWYTIVGTTVNYQSNDPYSKYK